MRPTCVIIPAVRRETYAVQLPVFEGPLDLLLRLIEREELDVTLVALAQVTDQYLAHLASLEEKRVGDLARFLDIAAKLLLIKSAALLARPTELTPEAETAGEELVQQLQEYKRFKEAAARLKERMEQGLRGYVRVAAPPRPSPQLDLGGVSVADLLRTVQEVLDAVPAAPVDEVVPPVTVTIEEQIALIESRLSRQERLRFRDVLSAGSGRVAVIVTLLAVLELVKQDRVRVVQEELFGEIFIERLTSMAMTPPMPSTTTSGH